MPNSNYTSTTVDIRGILDDVRNNRKPTAKGKVLKKKTVVGSSLEDAAKHALDEDVSTPDAFWEGLKGVGLLGGGDEIQGFGQAVGNLLGRSGINDYTRQLGFEFDPGSGDFATDLESGRSGAERYRDQAWQDNPYAYGAGGAVGAGLGLALPAGRLAKAGLSRYAGLAGVGAGYGALSGALEADPDSRLQGALEGGAFGAAAGPLFGRLADNLIQDVPGAYNAVRKWVSARGSEDVAGDAERIANEFSGGDHLPMGSNVDAPRPFADQEFVDGNGVRRDADTGGIVVDVTGGADTHTPLIARPTMRDIERMDREARRAAAQRRYESDMGLRPDSPPPGSPPRMPPKEVTPPVDPGFDPVVAAEQRKRLDTFGQPPEVIDPRMSTAEGAPDRLDFGNGRFADVNVYDNDGLNAKIASDPRFNKQPGDEAVDAGHSFDAVDAPSREGYVGGINTKNLDVSDDAKNVLSAAGDAAGVKSSYRSIRDTVKAGQQLGDEIGDIGDVSAVLAQGKEVVSRSANDLIEKARAVGVDSPDYHSSVLKFVEDVAAHSNNTSEWGRGGSALRAVVRDAKGRVNLTPNAVKTISKFAQNPENAQKLTDLIDHYKDDPEALNKIAQALTNKKAEDYLFSLWYNSVLSGPLTHARNILGNNINFITDLADHGLASVIGQTRRYSAGADRVFGREIAARLYGSVMGAMDAFGGNMWKAFKTGAPLDAVNRIDNPLAFAGKGPLAALETPTRLLSAEDEYFRSVAHMSELYGAAMRKAIIEKQLGQTDNIIARAKELVKNPTEDMIEKAADYARVIRFQDEPGPWSKALDQARAANDKDELGRRLSKAGLRVVIPFVRTPSSIIRTAIRHSPAGVLESRNLSAFKAGGAERDLAIARVALGSAATYGLVNFVMNGKITGDGPSDFRTAADKSVKAPPRSYTLDNGKTWHSYDNLGPVSALFSSVANAVENYQESRIDKGGYFGTMSKISVGIADGLMSNGWMDSLKNAFDMFAGPEGMREAAQANFVGGLASSPVPALIRQINQTFIDPQTHELRGDGSMEDRVKNRVISGIPGLSQDLPVKHDVYGRPIQRADQDGLFDIINPSRGKTVTDDTVANEVNRLLQTSPDGKSLVGPAPSNIKLPGFGNVRLPGKAYQQYQLVSGTYARTMIDEAIKSKNWATLNDDQRRAVVKDAVKNARKWAREDLFLSKYPKDAIADDGSDPDVEMDDESLINAAKDDANVEVGDDGESQ